MVATATFQRPDTELRGAARLVTLLRLLFLALVLGVLATLRGLSGDRLPSWMVLADQIELLLFFVAGSAGILAALVPWIRQRWQVLAGLFFDLAWIGALLFLTGGVGSPIAPLLPAVVLVSSIVLPGVGHVVLPLFGATLLVVSAIAYLAGSTPFDTSDLSPDHPLISPPRLIGNLVIQIGALFLVDHLGQALVRRLQEQRLVTGGLIDQLGEGVVAIDREGHVLYGNAAAGRLLGEERIREGNSLQDLLVLPLLAPARQRWLDGDLPFSMHLSDEQGRELMLRVGRLVGRRGRMVGTSMLLSDETQLRDLERGAQRTERLASLGEMAAGIAHEVRNPLTSLRGCAQELASIMAAGEGDEAALARIIMTEADRIGVLVEDFLHLSRLRVPDVDAVDLATEFGELEVMNKYRTDLPAELALQFRVADQDLPPIQADPGQLRQVLTNLISNAIDALVGRPGTISVTADRLPDAPDRLRLTVRDTGPGIPADRVEHIFNPFFSTKGQGTGLGLTLVSRIIDAHDAVISIDSGSGGTAVHIAWPIWFDQES